MSFTIKPLEWRIFCSTSGNCDAETPFGEYVIQSEPEDETPWWCMYLPNENDAHTAHPTLDAAKAAAQSDFETRIRSSLIPATMAGDGETGWRTMDSAPKDGTWLFLYVPGHGPARARWGGAGWSSHGGRMVIKATHWRPMFDHPAALADPRLPGEGSKL